MITCKDCGRELPEHLFYSRSTTKTRRQPCIVCYRARSLAHYHATKPDPTDRTLSLAAKVRMPGESAETAVRRAIAIQHKREAEAEEIERLAEAIKQSVAFAVGV